MTNIPCGGSKEIDLLAVNPLSGEKFHVESRVSTSRGFAIRLKDTHKKDGTPHRRGLDYFHKSKFEHPRVKSKIKEFFGDSDYNKILVVFHIDTGGLDDHVILLPAKEMYSIDIWFITDILEILKEKIDIIGSRDDVLRLIELIAKSEREEKKWVESMRKSILTSARKTQS